MRPRFLVPFVVTLLVGSAGVGVAVAAPAPSYDALVLADEEVLPDSVPTRVFDPSQLTVTSATGDLYASSGDDGTGSDASVSFRPPVGETFATRTEFNLLTAPTAREGAAVVTVGDVTCVPATYGLFVAQEAVVDPNGTLTALSAWFEVRCGSKEIRGNLRYHSSRPWSAVRLGAGTPDLGRAALGKSTTTHFAATVVGQGSAPLDGPSLYSALDTGATIARTTCPDTLDVGDRCGIDVRFAPRTTGTRPARLSFVSPGGTFGESAQILMLGHGLETDLGTFHSSGTTRVLDTRTTVGGHPGPLGPGGSVVVQPGTEDARVSAWVLNLTAVTPTASGYLTAYPTGGALPGTASVNIAGDRTVAHLVTVAPGTDASVTIRNAAGTTHVVADLVGWYGSDDGPLASGVPRGGGYHRSGVQRLLDTRTIRAVPAHQYVTVSARYPGRHVAALAVNVTVTAPSASGYVTAWDAATDRPPLASTLNFNRGETVSNAAIVPASACTAATGCTDSATIGVANGSGGTVHVVVDVTGYFDDGGVTADVRFHPLLSPTRVVDTRRSLGTTPFRAGETHSFVPSVVQPLTVALDGDITAVKPTTSTYLTVWPGTVGYQQPRTSTLNAAAGTVVGNHVLASVGGEDGRLDVVNATGTTDVVLDVDGTFDAFPSVPDDGMQQFRDASLPTSDSPVAPVYRAIT